MSASFVLLAAALAASLVLPAAGLATAPGGDGSRAGDPAGVWHTTAAAIRNMLNEAVEVKGGVQRPEGDVLRVELPAEGQVLFFTRPGHVAHPGVVEAQIVEHDGVPGITTSGWWAGDSKAFKLWFGAFERRNERLARQWEQESDPF